MMADKKPEEVTGVPKDNAPTAKRIEAHNLLAEGDPEGPNKEAEAFIEEDDSLLVVHGDDCVCGNRKEPRKQFRGQPLLHRGTFCCEGGVFHGSQFTRGSICVRRITDKT